MNKTFNRLAFVVLAISLFCGQAHAQFTTTFAKNASLGQQNGMFYALPQTMLQLDFIVRETVSEEGPLSDYASTYFENEDYVSNYGTTYELLDVRMSSKATPDPNAVFFVTFASGRGAGKTYFDVLPNGIIRSIGIVGNADDFTVGCIGKQEIELDNPIEPFPNSTAFMPLLTSGKSNAQLAKEANDKIDEIRKAKFFLISGDVEMATNPETFNTMYAKLDELEQQYLGLFLGTRVTRQKVHTVYVIPNKETPTQTVAKFSEHEGLTMGTNGVGTAIVVQTLPLNTTANINAPSQSAIESMSHENKVLYRIPETAHVRVSCGNRTMLEQRQTINQLGVLLMASVQGAKLVFDTETGQIVDFRMQ